MDVLDRSAHQKKLLTTVTIMVMVGLFVPIGLLIMKAIELSSSNEVFGYVKFGPLGLMQLQKIPAVGGGYEATIGFERGLIVYAVVWLVLIVGMLIGQHSRLRRLDT